MKCQHCGRLAQTKAWMEIVGGFVTVDLCLACYDRHEARRGRRSWLPVVICLGQPGLPALCVHPPIGPRSQTEKCVTWLPAPYPARRGTAVMTQSAVDLAKLRCPDCGATYLDFRRTGRLGCPYDYHVFGSGLAALLDRVHRARRHVGKRPCRPRRSPETDRQIRSLRRLLRSAVDAEDYAQAALLRDQIRCKERENGPQ